jgi:hypothetical protein
MRYAMFLLLFAAACSYALWRGGAPERIVASVFAIGLAGTLLLQAPLAARFGSLELGIFLTDVAMLGAIVAVALNADRFWPLWIGAFQIIQVLSHVPQAIIPHLLPTTYGAIVAIWSYPMLAILVAGTARHRRRLADYGIDPAWSVFPSAPAGGTSYFLHD